MAVCVSEVVSIGMELHMGKRDMVVIADKNCIFLLALERSNLVGNLLLSLLVTELAGAVLE